METTLQLTEKQRYWLEHLERARNTDSLAAYAKQQNLDVTTLYHYKKILRQKGLIESHSKFTRITQTSIIEQQNFIMTKSASNFVTATVLSCLLMLSI